MAAAFARHCAIALSLCGVVGPLAAQGVLEYDHARRQARLILVHGTVAETTLVAPGSRVAIRAPTEVQLRVSNTNTALYRFAQQAQAAPAPQLEPLRSFLGTLRPYLPEVALLTGGGVRPPANRDGSLSIFDWPPFVAK
jgi:hypothetical protein